MFTSKSAPAKTAALKLQFCRLAFFRVATLKFTPHMSLSSRSANFRLTPSMLDLEPAGSLKLQFLIDAPSKLAQRPFTPETFKMNNSKLELSKKKHQYYDIRMA